MRHYVVAISAICAFCVCGGPLVAVVQTIDATAQSTVRQFLPDNVVNSDAAFESLDETTSNLPLVAEARLLSSDSAAASSTSGTAITIFSDPRASQTEDPDEFAAELVAFSLDPVTRYEAVGTATENRQIVFTPEEIGAEAGAELLATSHFFLDGFLLIWGDLDPLVGPTEVKLQVRVHQTRPGQERQLVMEATVSLGQNSDGTPLLAAGGELIPDNLTLVDTLGSVLPLGDAYLATLPQLSIPYTYEALVDETFTLEAEVECSIANQPYTGAAVMLGIPFDQFLSSIGTVVDEPLSQSEALAGSGGVMPAPAKPLEGGRGTQVQLLNASTLSAGRFMPCGGLGLESLLLPVLLPVFGCFFSRRR